MSVPRPTAGRYADIFAYSPVAGPDRKIGVGLVVCFAAVTIGVLPWVRVLTPGVESLLPTVGAIALLAQVLIAALFVSQYAVNRHPPLFYAGIAFSVYFVFSALSWSAMPALDQTAGFFVHSLQTPGWLLAAASSDWLIPLLFVIGCDYAPTAAFCRRPRTMTVVLGLIVAGSLAFIAFAYGDPGLLPPLVDGVRITPFARGVVGPAVGVLTFVALALLLAVKRLRDAIDVWVAVGLVALCFEALLTLAGGRRDAFGFYAGRVLWAGSAVAILMLMQTKLYSLVLALMSANRELDSEALTDELTGLPNRRAFNRAVGSHFAAQRRGDRGVALLMIDLDEFKRYNDGFGHVAGDATLAAVAQAIDGAVARAEDTAARLGGEEFAVMLADADGRGAAAVAERIRAAVEALAIPHAPGASHAAVTVSIGVASTIDDPALATYDDLAALADAALYAAKRNGRNRIAIAPIPV